MTGRSRSRLQNFVGKSARRLFGRPEPSAVSAPLTPSSGGRLGRRAASLASVERAFVSARRFIDRGEGGPKKAVRELVQSGVVGARADDVAHLLRWAVEEWGPGAVGEALTEPGGTPAEATLLLQVRHRWFAGLDFTDEPFDLALRRALTRGGFQLPGEAQKVERVAEAFARAFFRGNRMEGAPDPPEQESDDKSQKDQEEQIQPSIGWSDGRMRLGSPEVAFVLCFSLIMLHTDAHNPSIRDDKRMSEVQFVRNNRGIDAGGADLPRPLLEHLYRAITSKEIRALAAPPPRAPARRSSFLSRLTGGGSGGGGTGGGEVSESEGGSSGKEGGGGGGGAVLMSGTGGSAGMALRAATQLARLVDLHTLPSSDRPEWSKPPYRRASTVQRRTPRLVRLLFASLWPAVRAAGEALPDHSDADVVSHCLDALGHTVTAALFLDASFEASEARSLLDAAHRALYPASPKMGPSEPPTPGSPASPASLALPPPQIADAVARVHADVAHLKEAAASQASRSGLRAAAARFQSARLRESLLADETRRVLFQGDVRKLSRAGRGIPSDYRCFLFSDIFIYGRRAWRWGAEAGFRAHQVVPLEHIAVEADPAVLRQRHIRNGFLVQTPAKPLVLIAPTSHEQHAWVRAINAAVKARRRLLAHYGDQTQSHSQPSNLPAVSEPVTPITPTSPTSISQPPFSEPAPPIPSPKPTESDATSDTSWGAPRKLRVRADGSFYASTPTKSAEPDSTTSVSLRRTKTEFRAAVDAARPMLQSSRGDTPDHTKAALFGFFQQARLGDAPAARGDVDSRLHRAWQKCAGMRRRDAMRAFVHLLDEQHPTWRDSSERKSRPLKQRPPKK